MNPTPLHAGVVKPVLVAALFGLFGVLTACSGDLSSAPASGSAMDATGGAVAASSPIALDPLAAPDVNTLPLGHVDLSPPEMDAAAAPRDLRRLDVDQLDAAILRTTGRRWLDATGKSQFEAFAATLGKPNFYSTVTEDLSVSLLFEKFLGDAARATCDSAVTANEPGLFKYAARDTAWSASTQPAIEANIRYLVLRFHGNSLRPESPELEPWKWLYQSTAFRTGQPKLAWRALCVALVTHPDFVAY